MPTVRELRGMAKTAKIKKYYRMNKAQLMAALGVQDTPRKTKAVGKKRQQIVKDLKHELDKLAPATPQNQKRKAAKKALAKHIAPKEQSASAANPNAYSIPKTGRSRVDAAPLRSLDLARRAAEITDHRGGGGTTYTMRSMKTLDKLSEHAQKHKVKDGFFSVGAQSGDKQIDQNIRKSLEALGGKSYGKLGEGGSHVFMAENGKARPLTAREKAAIVRLELHDKAIETEIPLIERHRSAGFNDPKLRKLIAEHQKTTNTLWVIEDKVLGRKPSKADLPALQQKLRTEAVAWAKSMGFNGEGVNGFSALATKAHDVAHPATHRLIGMGSAEIHQAFGSLKTPSGKPSLVAEEALVNAVEHLSRGDSLHSSIQNGLRLAAVQSRNGTKKEQDYVRSPEFARGIIDLIENRVYKNNEYSNIIKIVRNHNIISGTVTASGSDFRNSASGG